jgi:hypothetical protein
MKKKMEAIVEVTMKKQTAFLPQELGLFPLFDRE